MTTDKQSHLLTSSLLKLLIAAKKKYWHNFDQILNQGTGKICPGNIDYVFYIKQISNPTIFETQIFVCENTIFLYCQTPVLGLGLGVDFTFAGDNQKNHKNDNDNHYLNFVKGTVLGDKEQGEGIRDKG